MRLNRKNRQDIDLKGSGGIFDVLDDHIKTVYRINDNEYDYLCEVMTDEELDLFVREPATFGERKQLLLTVEKHLSNMRSYEELEREFAEAFDNKMKEYLLVGEIKEN